MDLVFLGPPGAGKGTQAKRVASRLGLLHLSTGDLLREAVAAKTALGVEARSYMDQGRLVPDTLVDRMIEEKLAGPAAAKGVLFDGYPRNLAQAQALDQALGRLGRRMEAVLLLEVPDADLEARLSGRRSCPKCKAMFHVTSNPPRQAGRCDSCGEALVVRDDDRPEVIRERLGVYHRETEPIAGHYRKQGLVRALDGTAAIEQVTGEVLRVLGRA